MREGVPVLLRAARENALALRDDLGHLAVEDANRERRHRKESRAVQRTTESFDR